MKKLLSLALWLGTTGVFAGGPSSARMAEIYQKGSVGDAIRDTIVCRAAESVDFAMFRAVAGMRAATVRDIIIEQLYPGNFPPSFFTNKLMDQGSILDVAVYLAVNAGYEATFEILKLILDYGVSPLEVKATLDELNRSGIYGAHQQALEKILAPRIKQERDIARLSQLVESGQHGQNLLVRALMRASNEGEEHIVKYLVETLGVPVDEAVIMRARQGGHAILAQYLREKMDKQKSLAAAASVQPR